MKKFTTQSTSLNSEKVNEPVVLDESATTRKVFLAEINDSKKETGETVSGTLVHQRKGPKSAWEDIKSINLNQLKAGEGVKFNLKSSHVKNLYDGLTQLYALGHQGVKFGKQEYVVGTSDEIVQVPKPRQEYIKRLLEENHGEEIWKELVDNNPDLATKLSYARLQSQRKVILDEFEKSLGNSDLKENYWQDFFSENDWIFGYGLNYQFLSVATDQPDYGGSDFTGKGKQKGDYLGFTQAEMARFTVLVEIKRPDSPLISKRNRSGEEIKYRNGAYLLSGEVIGGLSQLQVNCASWQRSSEQPQNHKLQKENIFTIKPKGILVIGHTQQIHDDQDKINTFELYRQGLNNVEIMTYDELLARARFILGSAEAELNEQLEEDDDDDLPF